MKNTIKVTSTIGPRSDFREMSADKAKHYANAKRKAGWNVTIDEVMVSGAVVPSGTAQPYFPGMGGYRFF